MLEDREKKLVYIAIAVIIILIIVVIIIIWSPMFADNEKEIEISTVNEYEDGYYISAKKEEYKAVVTNAVNKDNFENTYLLLDQDYLNEMNMTEAELKEYLNNNNILTYTTTTAVVYCDKVLTNNEKYIYTYVYKIGNTERKVHIIEDYYEKYTISFAQDYYPILDSNEYDIIDSETGLEFKIKVANSYEENVVFNVTIVNNTTEEFNFKFTSVSDSNLMYYTSSDSISVATLSSIVVGTQISEINSIPGGTSSITLSYSIAIDDQSNITTLLFNDVVKSNGDTINIRLLLN